MPKVSASIPHNHDPDEVVKRTRSHIEKMVDDFDGQDFQLEWSGRTAEFSFTVFAFKISGNVLVEETQITVDVDLPFAATMFKDKIQKAITENLAGAVEAGDENEG